MLWIKSGIENPSKSEGIGRCGGDEKTNDHPEPIKMSNAKNISNIYAFHPNICLCNVVL